MNTRRNVECSVEYLLSHFPVVVILGVRQSGKTTLARMMRPNWNYFDLEKGSDYDFITGDFDFFFRQYPDSVVIDESQFSDRLFHHGGMNFVV